MIGSKPRKVYGQQSAQKSFEQGHIMRQRLAKNQHYSFYPSYIVSTGGITFISTGPLTVHQEFEAIADSTPVRYE